MDTLVHFPLPGRTERMQYLFVLLQRHLCSFIPDLDRPDLSSNGERRLMEEIERVCSLHQVVSLLLNFGSIVHRYNQWCF